jgi:hypothetical protein
MSRAILIDSLPWLTTLLVALLGLRAVVLLRGRNEAAAWQRLKMLHADQNGAVQTLSFVLTVPIFVLFVLLVVQVSQIMIAQVVVHYAAFAAARSAIVWIPAHTDEPAESANCISSRTIDRVQDQGVYYRIGSHGPKYNKIRSAAVLACAPLAPSRNMFGAIAGDARADAMLAASQALSPALGNNSRLAQRIQNKLSYSEQATRVELTCYHPDHEPPLQHYYEWIDEFGIRHWVEFEDNEIGWQDTITATVTHDFALLPGPARILSRRANATSQAPSDVFANRLRRRGLAYVIPLTASATLGNEGEKSVLPDVHFSAR